MSNIIEHKNYILEEIPLIESYNDYEKEKINNNNYCILYKTKKYIRKFYRKFDKNLVYLFVFKNEYYIYFSDKKEIFQLNKIDNILWTLREIKRKMSYIDIIKIINDIIKKNKRKENIQKYLNLYYKDFKEFYLINEKWLSKQIDNNEGLNIDLITPHFSRTSFKYKYPVNFGIIENSEKELINQLITNNKIINKEELYLTKMFFVEGKNNTINKNIYIGLFKNDDNIIYFYLIENEGYSIEFSLEYNNKDLIFLEINNLILKNGIETYLYDMGVFLSKKEKQDLIKIKNNEFEKIGLFYDLKKNRQKVQINTNSRNLENIMDSYYYNGVIQCLVNIEPFKNIFLNREILMDKMKNLKNKTVIFHFFKLMQYMWNININNNDNDYEDNNNNSNQSTIFLIEIKKIAFSNDQSLLKNIDLLIEFLILSMNLEYALINDNSISINYNIEYLKLICFSNKPSFIRELFFFQLQSTCCKKSNLAYLLSFNNEDLYKEFKNNKIKIESILTSGKTNITCKKCFKTNTSKIHFISFPKLLIIVIKSTENKKNCVLNFEAIEKMKIKNINQNIQEYELISMIIKKENTFATYCKTFMDKNRWIEYLEEEKGQKININKSLYDINKENKPINPYLLIFQKLN